MASAPLLRWALPVALLVTEYLTLSFLVDLPTSGPAMRLVGVVRLLVPVVIGGGAAGWLLARRSLRQALRDSAASLPPWRPWPALAAHLVAFTATAAAAHHLMREGAPPVTPGRLTVWLGGVAVAVLLAMSSAAPLRWTLRVIAVHWRGPLLALAVGLLAWRAAAAAEDLWGILSAGTIRAVAWLLRLAAGEATFDPAQSLIGLRGFDVRVAPICSGVDGVGLVVLFQAVWISLARSRIRLRRALLLLPLGAVTAMAVNALRIAAMIMVGASGREGLAMGGLHSKLGWLLFTAMALGSVALAENLPWLQRPGAAAIPEDEEVPRAAVSYLAPLLAALGSALVTSIWSEGAFDSWYGLRIVAAVAVLFLVRETLPRISISWSWAPVVLAAATCAMWVSFVDGDRRALLDGVGRMEPAARWTWIVVRATGSVLVVPVVEELAFRGFLLPWLVSPMFESVAPRVWTWSAVVLSSLAFGALHEHWVLGTIAGLAFAAARLHRGRLGDAVLAHALCNGGITAAVLLAGRWDLWA